MSEYVFSVFAVCLIMGGLRALCYGGGVAEKLTMGIITLAVIITPISSLISDFDVDSWLESLEDGGGGLSGESGVVIEEAFAEGVCSAVAEKFSLEREDVRVRLSGFDAEAMRAEKIRITLSGAAALADYKAVEKYISGLGLGGCEVGIEIK